MVDRLIQIATQVLIDEKIIDSKTAAEDVPIFKQGSLGEDEAYPDTFLTFWENPEAEQTAYDNGTATVVWSFDVNGYSTSPNKLYSLMNALRAAYKADGWQTPDRGHDVASDEITHTGRGISVTYLKTFNPIKEDN